MNVFEAIKELYNGKRVRPHTSISIPGHSLAFEKDEYLHVVDGMIRWGNDDKPLYSNIFYHYNTWVIVEPPNY